METFNKNQQNILKFLIKLLCQEEKEEYILRDVNLSGTIFTPKDKVASQMIVIGNNEYWQDAYSLTNKISTEGSYVQYLNVEPTNAKALFLKYKIIGDEKKPFFLKSSIAQILDPNSDLNNYNMQNFPYLVFAFERLYANAKDDEITDEVIDETLKEIRMLNENKFEFNRKQYYDAVLGYLNENEIKSNKTR